MFHRVIPPVNPSRIINSEMKKFLLISAVGRLKIYHNLDILIIRLNERQNFHLPCLVFSHKNFFIQFFNFLPFKNLKKFKIISQN